MSGDAGEDAKPTARAWIDIARPKEAVRAQFFDLEHAIATQPYHGVALSWAPLGENGEKRARQEIRVLAQPVIDDFVIEEGKDGAWVKRFVGGTNAGARYVATFAAADEGGTRVEIEAFAPKGGFNLGVGKLSALGLEKALKKMLVDHQRAIEKYEFVPGSAREPVTGVLAALEDMTAPLANLDDGKRRAMVATLLEAASLVAVADNDADAAEREVMDEIARALCGQSLDEDTRARLVRGAERGVGSEGMGSRCEKLGQRLARLGVAELGLTVAAIVGEISHGIDPPELAAMQKIAAGANLPEAALTSILDRVGEEAVPLVSVKMPPKPPPLPTKKS
jgi:tellurite resistance protein